ncbi:oligosaccharide flippase family protein [Oceaniglobus roseus]|uniref:oligosaccharide flippase family protein n=1 Tax=Oceaniglobus roseus TaxID=1737570 RepID=UPI0015621544|nr:oligosaccharide flippase family protein [Kandeliimicrobium roseum]
MRRAFFFANIEQYVVAIVGLIGIAVTSRLLGPAEIGVAAIGLGVFTVAFAAREFVSAEFLIQRPEIAPGDIDTAFTVAALSSLAIAALLSLLAGPVADAYGAPEAAGFLRVLCLVGLADALSAPTLALLRREMAFDRLARVNIAASLTTVGVTVGLAGTGFGLMSIAWGHAAGAAMRAAFCLVNGPQRGPRRPSLAAWRAMLAFGGSKGAITVIDRIYESLPQLVLGRTMPAAAVGMYSRASVLASIPDRFLMAAVFAFAFPALAAQVREGRDPRAAYLNALSYVAAVYCPALALVALLAGPVVELALGPGWETVVPLLQLMTLAAMFWVPMIITSPTLFALGANRDAFVLSLTGRLLGASVMVGASFFGLIAMAASQFFTLPVYAVLSLRAAQRRIGFGWRALAEATWRSVAVIASALVPPCLFTLLAGHGLSPTLAEAPLCTVLAAAGWFAGLKLARHPLLLEVTLILALLRRRLPGHSLPAALNTGADR